MGLVPGVGVGLPWRSAESVADGPYGWVRPLQDLSGEFGRGCATYSGVGVRGVVVGVLV